MTVPQLHPRMCDGQPRHKCPSGCKVDCKFNNDDLADRARHLAAETFHEPDYGRAYEVSLNDDMRMPTPLHIRALDWLGNLPRRIGRWVDRSPVVQTLCFAIGAVVACALAALTLFHK